MTACLNWEESIIGNAKGWEYQSKWTDENKMLNDKSMLRGTQCTAVSPQETRTHALTQQHNIKTHNKPGFQRVDLFVVVVHTVVEKAYDCGLGYKDKTHTHTH